MLLAFIFKSNPFRKNIYIRGVLYSKSNKLKKIDLILYLTRIMVGIVYLLGVLYLNEKGILIFNVEPAFLMPFSVLFIIFIMMFGSFLFLPKPIQNHLTKVETET